MAGARAWKLGSPRNLKHEEWDKQTDERAIGYLARAGSLIQGWAPCETTDHILVALLLLLIDLKRGRA